MVIFKNTNEGIGELRDPLHSCKLHRKGGSVRGQSTPSLQRYAEEFFLPKRHDQSNKIINDSYRICTIDISSVAYEICNDLSTPILHRIYEWSIPERILSIHD